jgi:hypothetical protein
MASRLAEWLYRSRLVQGVLLVPALLVKGQHTAALDGRGHVSADYDTCRTSGARLSHGGEGMVQPWKGLGPGVLEIVESHDGSFLSND